MTAGAFIGLLLAFIILAALLCYLWAPAITDNLPPAKLKSPCPSCCFSVAIEDIEQPINGQSRVSLKLEYIDAQERMVDGHDPTMTRKIRQEMAECLREGWPLDVAVCQAAYCFITGPRQCQTCKSLTQQYE